MGYKTGDPEIDTKYNFDSKSDYLKWRDDIVDTVVQKIKSSGSSDCRVLNLYGAKKIIMSYGILKYISKEKNITITYQLNEPIDCSGGISMIAERIDFNPEEMKMFSVVAKAADNFDITPRTDGKIQIGFAYSDMTLDLI